MVSAIPGAIVRFVVVGVASRGPLTSLFNQLGGSGTGASQVDRVKTAGRHRQHV